MTDAARRWLIGIIAAVLVVLFYGGQRTTYTI